MPIILKSGSLRLLEPSGPVQACNGIALLYIEDLEVDGRTMFKWIFKIWSVKARRGQIWLGIGSSTGFLERGRLNVQAREGSGLQECYLMSFGEKVPIFRRNVVPPPSTCLTLQTNTLPPFETVGTTFPSTQRSSRKTRIPSATLL